MGSERSPVVGAIAFVHLAYLLSLPIMGFAGFHQAGPGDPKFVMWIWVPLIVYVALLLQGYRLSNHPLRALFVVLLVPVQVAVANILRGGDFYQFVYESASIEVASIVFGVCIAMFIHRPSGWGGAVVGLLLAAAWLPFVSPLVRAASAWDPWSKSALAAAFVTALVEHTHLFTDAARKHNAGGGVQIVEFEHGDEGLLAFFRSGGDAVEVGLERKGQRIVFWGLCAAFCAGTLVSYKLF